ncbi:MAG: hypothetical protein WC891_03050 [Actinomycetota bacterium]
MAEFATIANLGSAGVLAVICWILVNASIKREGRLQEQVDIAQKQNAVLQATNATQVTEFKAFMAEQLAVTREMTDKVSKLATCIDKLERKMSRVA